MVAPDPLTSGVVFAHQVLIISIAIVVTFYFFEIWWKISYPFGMIDMNPFSNIPIISLSLYLFSWFVVKICEIIIWILLVLFFWIFVFWLLILLFVPYIIIFPIPIPPFIFILPLKPILLAVIPPFKVLTDLGSLPLMLRTCTRLISPQIFTNTMNYLFYPTVKDFGSYFQNHVNETAKNIIGDDIQDLYTTEDNNYDEEEYFDNNFMDGDKEDIKKYNEYKENTNVKQTMKNIDEDTQMCIKLNQSFKPYNNSYVNDASIDMNNSFNPYSKCYTSAIKSYLKTSIT
jgi:hypothetical protein